MKKKYINETYLRGVDDYDIKTIKEKDFDCYTTIKRIKSIDKPYISTHTGTDMCLLDIGYYIIEYLPVNEKYGVRIFMNENKEILQYYIDITKKNGFENNTPFYYDLYLDITIDMFEENIVTVLDEDELLEALELKKISSKDYIMAHNVVKKLLNQIDNNENIYINRAHKEIVNDLMPIL